ncbi:MAG: serine hydrolase [Candidatus Binatia bacterium]|nr:serine hydrolase [Candidatus Binatia bacterium]
MSDAESQGICARRFARVREVFDEGFRERGELGAAVTVTVGGETVVDLWGGHADVGKTKPWERDTLVNVYSTTKGMTAICAHQLIDEGLLDLDAPVAEYWPEFAQGGKERMPVRMLFCHQGGLAAVEEVLPAEALYSWTAMCDALAAQTPWWTPGESHGYHAVTFGWLVGELVCRLRGKSLGTVFRERIAEPLAADFWIGLPPSEHPRVTDIQAAPPGAVGDTIALAEAFLTNPTGLVAKAFLNPPSMALGANNAPWREAEIPGANGHATARGIARVYAALANGGEVDGVHVLSPEGVERCRTEQSHGQDLVLQRSTRFGLGFMLPQDEPGARIGGDGAFGHPGAGGSLGFADPEARVSFGYTMNQMGPHILLDPRATALVDATYRCLEQGA